MANERLYELFARWIDGTANPDEEDELGTLLADPQLEPAVKELLDQSWERLPLAYTLEEEAAGQLFSRVLAAQPKAAPPAVRHRIPLRRWIAAASILLVLGLGIGIWQQTRHRATAPLVYAQNDIPPGGNRATLTLANGQKIFLDSATNGTLAQQGSTQIIKLDSGQLSYHVSLPITSKSEIINHTSEIYNTLTTPRGGQYQLTLSDGTRVWLNAASSITYPTAFNGHERKVAIQGEAYFEVTKDATKPFRVRIDPNPGSASPAEIEVLGTRFNVNAYGDEPFTTASLLQGAIRLATDPATALLRPGQQGQLLRGTIQVKNDIDTGAVMAWKNGNFRFVRADMATVLRQLARWYDVEPQYNGTIDAHFGGTIARDVPLSRVIQMLELTGAVKFIIEGKKLIVMADK